MSEIIFKIGGITFVVSGTIGLFYFFLAIFGLFDGAALIPSMKIIMEAEGVMILEKILIAFFGLIFNIGLILVGMVVARLHELKKNKNNNMLEEKINKLQNITWRIFQHLKKKS